MSEPRTINLPGSGTDTQQHELAPGLLQYVESVYVEIDNSGGGDARPTLTLAEQSGVVIAKKRQGEAIGGGNSGSATWALRLTDELTLATSPIVQFDFTTSTANPNSAKMHATFLGWTGAKPLTGKFLTITVGLIALNTTRVKIAYQVITSKTVLLTLVGADVQNFTTGQSERLSGNTITAPGGSSDFLTWDNDDAGPALLDLTFPKQPQITVAGNYVLNLTLSVDQP